MTGVTEEREAPAGWQEARRRCCRIRVIGSSTIRQEQSLSRWRAFRAHSGSLDAEDKVLGATIEQVPAPLGRDYVVWDFADCIDSRTARSRAVPTPVDVAASVPNQSGPEDLIRILTLLRCGRAALPAGTLGRFAVQDRLAVRFGSGC